MQTTRPVSQLLSQCCRPTTFKPTSALTSARHLSTQPPRPLAPAKRKQTPYRWTGAPRDHRYNSTNSSSNAPGATFRRVPSSQPQSSSQSSPSSGPWPPTHHSSEPTRRNASEIPNPIQSARGDEPAFAMAFTCKPKEGPPCGHRAWHRITKHGYFNGTVLVQCPGCGRRHLISDHLKIFSDTSVTVEDLMERNGELVKRGAITDGSDVEFWDDDAGRRKELERAAGIQAREDSAVAQGYTK
ncbi:MAG: hypothetical protein M1820_007940 [Bogoriella megaspora]|nr:MAG: hypothetical protein M1820_007940 [Bogoriella megaspora]